MHDSIEPGAEFGCTPKIRQRPISFHKYILCDLLRIFPYRGIAECQRKNKILVSPDQLGIYLLLAAQYSCNKILIGDAGIHYLQYDYRRAAQVTVEVTIIPCLFFTVCVTYGAEG